MFTEQGAPLGPAAEVGGLAVGGASATVAPARPGSSSALGPMTSSRDLPSARTGAPWAESPSIPAAAPSPSAGTPKPVAAAPPSVARAEVVEKVPKVDPLAAALAAVPVTEPIPPPATPPALHETWRDIDSVLAELDAITGQILQAGPKKNTGPKTENPPEDSPHEGNGD